METKSSTSLTTLLGIILNTDTKSDIYQRPLEQYSFWFVHVVFKPAIKIEVCLNHGLGIFESSIFGQ